MTLLEQYKKCMNEFKPLLIGVSEAMYNPILIRMNTKDLNANLLRLSVLIHTRNTLLNIMDTNERKECEE